MSRTTVNRRGEEIVMVTLRVRKATIEAVDALAKETLRSRNQMVNRLLERALERAAVDGRGE